MRERFHRRWTWGGPCEVLDMRQSWALTTSWEPGQFGLSLGWDCDAGGLVVMGMVGPFDVLLLGPPPAWAVRRGFEHGPARRLAHRGRWSLFWSWRWCGASVEAAKTRFGRFGRVRVGPACLVLDVPR